MLFRIYIQFLYIPNPFPNFKNPLKRGVPVATPKLPNFCRNKSLTERRATTMLVYVLELESSKWYVGVTDDLHFSLADFDHSALSWTNEHRPRAVESLIPDCDFSDGDKYTLRYMSKYGILNVRGGSFCASNLSNEEIITLVKLVDSADKQVIEHKTYALKSTVKIESPRVSKTINDILVEHHVSPLLQSKQPQPEENRDSFSRIVTLVNNIKGCETSIKDLKKNRVDKDVPNLVAAQFADMRRLYLSILANPQHAISAAVPGFDMHSSLWKNCFYNQIEDYRKSIRKCFATATLPTGDKDESKVDAATVERSKHHLARLTMSFSKFLSDGIIFYTDMMIQAEQQMAALFGRRESDQPDGESSKKRERSITGTEVSWGRDDLLNTIYRCLLYLGDLSRYSAQNSSADVKDFSKALRYYERASYVNPKSGNPHNQLAVLAGYEKNDCVAVYNYCRSVMTAQPFLGGYENLSLLFAKTARTTRAGDSDGRANQDKSARARVFLIRFVQLHGVLFNWSKSAYGLPLVHNLAQGILNATAVSELKAPAVDTTLFQADLVELLDEYDAILASAAYGDSLLIKLLVICMFSVHRAQVPGPGSFGRVGEDYPYARTTGESLSLLALYGFVSRTASRIETLFVDVNSSKRSYANKLIVVLSVFAEWCCCHPQYLLSNTASSNGGASINPILFADEKLIAEEAKGRAAMRTAVLALQGHLETGHESAVQGQMKLWRPPSKITDIKRKSASERESDLPLREHVELRGLLPLAESYEKYFAGNAQLPHLNSELSAVPEKQARERRQNSLREFIKSWLLPCARREAEELDGKRMEAAAAHLARSAPPGKQHGHQPSPKYKSQRDKHRQRNSTDLSSSAEADGERCIAQLKPQRQMPSPQPKRDFSAQRGIASPSPRMLSVGTDKNAAVVGQVSPRDDTMLEQDSEPEDIVVYKPVFAKRMSSAVEGEPFNAAASACELNQGFFAPIDLMSDFEGHGERYEELQDGRVARETFELGSLQGFDWAAWGASVEENPLDVPLSRVPSGGNWWESTGLQSEDSYSNLSSRITPNQGILPPPGLEFQQGVITSNPFYSH